MSVLLIAADQIEPVLYLIEVRFIILSMAGFQSPSFRGNANGSAQNAARWQAPRSNAWTVIPGRCEASSPESRDSPMRNWPSEVWCWRTIPE
jgi:hypothetical protein